MSKKKYNQSASSLRLMLTWDKFSKNKEIIAAYNILCRYPKSKARFITDAINYYDSLLIKNSKFDKTLSEMRIIKYIKRDYMIETLEDLKKVLEVDVNGAAYSYIKQRVGIEQPPAKMLCGFSISDKKAVEMHSRLFSMSVNDRINLISTAVIKYVEDNKAPCLERIIASTYLKDVIDKYKACPEQQNAILNDFFKLMKLSKELENTKNESEKSIAEEISSFY